MKKTKGFSLVEMIVVIAIIGMALSMVVLNSRQARNQALLESGQASIINALELAKNRAASGVGNAKHGVRIDQNEIIIFEGDDFLSATNTRTMRLSSPLYTDKNGFDIIFERINAKPDTGTTVEIAHPSNPTEPIRVTIDEQGVISNQ